MVHGPFLKELYKVGIFHMFGFWVGFFPELGLGQKRFFLSHSIYLFLLESS